MSEDQKPRPPGYAGLGAGASTILLVAGNIAPAFVQRGEDDPAEIAEKAYAIAEALARLVQARWKG